MSRTPADQDPGRHHRTIAKILQYVPTIKE